MFRHYVYYLTWSYHIIMIIFTHIYQPILHIHICRLLISTWSNFKEPIELLRHRNSITIHWIHNTKNQPSVRQRPFLGRGGRGNLTIYRYKYRYLSRWGKRKPSWKRKKKLLRINDGYTEGIPSARCQLPNAGYFKVSSRTQFRTRSGPDLEPLYRKINRQFRTLNSTLTIQKRKKVTHRLIRTVTI